MTIIAVFKSRSQTLDAIKMLAGAGVPAAAVSTPKEAGVGCGISVRFEERFLPRVQSLLYKRRYSSFAGMMKSDMFGFRYIS